MIRTMKLQIVFSLWVGMGLLFPVPGVADIRMTLHNLSAVSPNEIRAVKEDAVCVFCHAPHGAVTRRALWNRPLETGSVFRVFKSLGSVGGMRQPDGASKMCLSCHDGSISIGKLANRKKTLRIKGGSGFGGVPRKSQAWLGSNLAGLHPVSVNYSDSVRHWATMRSRRIIGVETRFTGASLVPRDLLDREGKVQCTSCHDPHEDKYYQSGVVPHFSRRPTVEEICVSCHRW